MEDISERAGMTQAQYQTELTRALREAELKHHAILYEQAERLRADYEQRLADRDKHHTKRDEENLEKARRAAHEAEQMKAEFERQIGLYTQQLTRETEARANLEMQHHEFKTRMEREARERAREIEVLKHDMSKKKAGKSRLDSLTAMLHKNRQGQEESEAKAAEYKAQLQAALHSLQEQENMFLQREADGMTKINESMREQQHAVAEEIDRLQSQLNYHQEQLARERQQRAEVEALATRAYAELEQRNAAKRSASSVATQFEPTVHSMSTQYEPTIQDDDYDGSHLSDEEATQIYQEMMNMPGQRIPRWLGTRMVEVAVRKDRRRPPEVPFTEAVPAPPRPDIVPFRAEHIQRATAFKRAIPQDRIARREQVRRDRAEREKQRVAKANARATRVTSARRVPVAVVDPVQQIAAAAAQLDDEPDPTPPPTSDDDDDDEPSPEPVRPANVPIAPWQWPPVRPRSARVPHSRTPIRGERIYGLPGEPTPKMIRPREDEQVRGVVAPAGFEDLFQPRRRRVNE